MYLVKNLKKLGKPYSCDLVLAKETRGMFSCHFWERVPCLKKAQGKGIFVLTCDSWNCTAHPGAWGQPIWGQSRGDNNVQPEQRTWVVGEAAEVNHLSIHQLWKLWSHSFQGLLIVCNNLPYVKLFCVWCSVEACLLYIPCKCTLLRLNLFLNYEVWRWCKE